MQEKVLIPSKKETIAAIIHRPRVSTDALAVITPGYLDTKDYPHLAHLAEALAEKGYAAVRYDPSGTWESIGGVEDYTIDRQLVDVRTILDHFFQERTYSRVLLVGHSRGGLISMLYAPTDQRVSGVLAIMSPNTIVSTAQQHKIVEWKRTGFRLSRRDIPHSSKIKEFRVPYADIEKSLKRNALEAVKQIHTPLFCVTGESDEVVPPEDVRVAYDKANEPKYFLNIKNIGHDYRHSTTEIEQVDSQLMQLLANGGF